MAHSSLRFVEIRPFYGFGHTDDKADVRWAMIVICFIAIMIRVSG